MILTAGGGFVFYQIPFLAAMGIFACSLIIGHLLGGYINDFIERRWPR